MRKIGRWFFSFLLCSLPAWAELEFFQFADKTTVSLEETFQLNVVVTNPPHNAFVELPSSQDFEILSRSHSTQLQYKTGSHLQKEQHYLLTLRAKKEGRLVLPAALLKVGKNTYKTETIAIDVTRGHASPTTSKNTPPIPRSDSDLFIRMTLDKSSAYVGEQVLLSVSLYSRTAHADFESISMPTLKGFFTEDIEPNSSLLTDRKSVDGIHYYVTTFKKRALFAMKPGNYTLEPATADLIVRQLFRGRVVRRESNALTLEIKPLPAAAENLPVGQWKLELKAPPPPFTAGQPVELSLTLRGVGNIRNLPPVELQFPDSFKTFPPTLQNNIQTVGNKLLGNRTLQYVVIPQQPGNFTLPAVKFDYFNTETQQPDTTQTPPLSWVVGPGNNTPAASTDTPTNPTPAEQEIHPIRYHASLSPPSPPLAQKNFYGLFVALPLALRLFGMLLQLAFSKMGSPEKKQQRQREKSTLNAIHASLGELKKNPHAASFSQLGKNMLAFLECKLGFSTQGLLQEQLNAKMQAHGLPEHLCQQVLYILSECDTVQFGHSPPSAPSINNVCETMLHILKRWP